MTRTRHKTPIKEPRLEIVSPDPHLPSESYTSRVKVDSGAKRRKPTVDPRHPSPTMADFPIQHPQIEMEKDDLAERQMTKSDHIDISIGKGYSQEE